MTQQDTNVFQQALKIILKHEGGYVNDPSDSGGETNYGITKNTAAAAGYKGSMKSIPMEVVEKIYKDNYWNKLCLDIIAAKDVQLAIILFDSAVNCGPSKASTWLQRALQLLTDKQIQPQGNVGPLTLSTFESLSNSKLPALRQIVLSLRGGHYIEISEKYPKNTKFLSGWFSRLSTFY